MSDLVLVFNVGQVMQPKHVQTIYQMATVSSGRLEPATTVHLKAEKNDKSLHLDNPYDAGNI